MNGWLQWPCEPPRSRPATGPSSAARGRGAFGRWGGRRFVQGEARIAVIARRNRAGRVEWCLPKGHIEGEETLPQTAVREVAEETGILGKVLVELGTIDFWFAAGDRRIHKYVHHYLLEAVSGDLTIENDPDHEAIDVAWFPLREAHRHLTFPNERRIAREAWQRLAGEG